MRSLVLACLLGGCGAASHPVCPSETHAADPDGRGERCVDDRSTCDQPSDCTTDDPCCEATCEDSTGTGLYQCATLCGQAECTPGSCPAGFVCEGEACAARCVPEGFECSDDAVPADPAGLGAFLCVRQDSTCFAPADCPGDAYGCCTSSCEDQGDGLWACEDLCMDGDREADWQCTVDADCDATLGMAGGRCEQDPCYGNFCVPPPACVTAADCALAVDTSQCCEQCAQVVPESVFGTGCWQRVQLASPDGGAPPPDDLDPPDCAPDCSGIDCPAVECPVPPVDVDCQEGVCVGLFY